MDSGPGVPGVTLSYVNGSYDTHGVIQKPRGQDEVGGWSNVHDCPREVGRWSSKCQRGQNSKTI